VTDHLLDALDDLLARFVAFPSDHDRHSVAAWVLHCWTLQAFDSTPRLALLSPEKGSGKTRTLEVLELVVPGPRHTVNMSAAALFRLVGGDEPVTLLMDEADTYLGWKVARDHEDIRGLVNAGHRRGAVTYRVSIESGPASVQEFAAFAPVALAGIGDLPDTIIDRSVVIAMRRRAPDEPVQPFRRRKIAPEVAGLRDAIEGWAADHLDRLADSLDDLDLPDGIEDRPADVWEPLIAIGDAAGPVWSDRLRTAAVVLNGQRAERDPSLGMQLLRDVRDVFHRLGVDRIPSVDLARELVDIEGAPWSDLRGKPIDAPGVAKRLRQYQVRPAVHRFGEDTARGYLVEDFYDVWRRYLPPPVSVTRVTPVTGVTEQAPEPPPVTPVTPVTPVRDRGTRHRDGASTTDHHGWRSCPSCGRRWFGDGPCRDCDLPDDGPRCVCGDRAGPDGVCAFCSLAVAP
jgi:hypothetical protein